MTFKIFCQPEFATYLLIVVSAHWGEYVFEDVVHSITQCPFYEDPWEKFLSGLSTRKSCTSPEQLVCLYFMDTENLCFPLCFGHEEAQNSICGPPLAIVQDFMACIYILILLASYIPYSYLYFLYSLTSFIYILFTYMYIYIYVYLHPFLYNMLECVDCVYMSMYVCMYVFICTRTHIHICRSIIVCVCIFWAASSALQKNGI